MSQANTLITSNLVGVECEMTVTNNYWNCCDAPQRGDIIGSQLSNRFTYVRTDGHGCNGKQGQFEIGAFFAQPIAGQQLFRIQLDFDSEGNIELSPTTPNPNPPGILQVFVTQITSGPDSGKFGMSISTL